MLVDVGDGPLAVILSYLQPNDVSRAEITCLMIRTNARLAWEHLDSQISSLSQSEALSPKERVFRFHKAMEYSARIEAAAGSLVTF